MTMSALHGGTPQDVSALGIVEGNHALAAHAHR
jgi:hypothetical protein